MNETAPISGEIVASSGRQCDVQLTDGRIVQAVIPKTRRFGCLFGDLTGWGVQILPTKAPGTYRIVELSRPKGS